MIRRVLLAAVGALLVIAGCHTGWGTALWPAKSPAQADDGIEPNDMCYVCHLPFTEEPLAIVHDKAKVWCRQCHGPSAAHMQNENIGATPADIAYRKDQVDRMCAKCHKPTKHPKITPELRDARLGLSKKAQQEIKGRTVKVTGVCTDCHGRHWIPPREE